MALKKADVVINVGGPGFPVPVGESWLLKNIIARSTSAYSYMTFLVQTSNTEVLKITQYNTFGRFLDTVKGMARPKNLLSYLYEKGIWRGIPIGEGENLFVQVQAAYNAQSYFIVDVFDAGDKKPTDPNGSDGAEYDFVTVYSLPSGTFASGDNWLTGVLGGPIVFEVQGNELRVPVNKEITIFGFMTRDVRKVSGTDANEQNSTYLKFVKNREVLFANDVNGIPIFGDTSQVTDGTYIGNNICISGMYDSAESFEPYLFQVPLVLGEGEKIGISLMTQVTKGVANMAYNDYMLYLICRSRRLR
jgi:hypothetical protein